jgi:hypothetical protein
MDEDYVWVHDYHLLVLPSLVRKRFHRLRLGLFLHSPFPSSEVFRTFPRREELLRSLLNADLIGAAGYHVALPYPAHTLYITLQLACPLWPEQTPGPPGPQVHGQARRGGRAGGRARRPGHGAGKRARRRPVC